MRPKETCQGQKQDGTPCKGRASAGKKYYFNHDPDNFRPRQDPSLKELLEEEIARIDGYPILSDYQLEKIAGIVLSKINQAIAAIANDFGKNEHR